MLLLLLPGGIHWACCTTFSIVERPCTHTFGMAIFVIIVGIVVVFVLDLAFLLFERKKRKKW